MSMQRLNKICQQLTPAPSADAGLATQATYAGYNPAAVSPAAISQCPAAARCPALSSGAEKPVMSVCVTGAAGNIGYAILFMIAQGKMLGDQPLELRLLDIPPMAKALEGVKMELLDGAFPVIHNIIATTDYKVAFDNVDIALLVGAKPRGPGMVRADLLRANAAIFKGQGTALNTYAKKSVKVLVVGNPANTNALIAKANAPNLPATAFSAMTRLDENRAKGQIAARAGVNVSQVRNLVVWGNHSATQFPDVSQGVITDFPSKGTSTSIRGVICDDEWLNGPFIKTVQTRGKAIINARKKSSAASAASAAVDHMRSWVLGSDGQYASMGVPSDGSYGVPKGLVFSFPVICQGGSYTIVQGLKHSAFGKEKLRLTIEELLSEKRMALGE